LTGLRHCFVTARVTRAESRRKRLNADARIIPDMAANVEQTGESQVNLRDRVVDALRNVHDPELGINIVDLGLVYGVDVADGTVHITYTLTTMGCPIGPLIEAEIRQFLADVDGVNEVEAEMVLRPPWTPEMMSEEAKAALGFF
jgi:metal-sulfur cluster biosynthetic enzyme